MNAQDRSRRQFLGEASCAAVGSGSVISSLLSLQLANKAAAAGLPRNFRVNDRKTLVCVFLAGGCDTFNLLVNREQHRVYSSSRSNVALKASQLLPIRRAGQSETNRNSRYGLHPACKEIAHMFNGTGAFKNLGRRLSFVSNVGTLVVPTSKEQYLQKSVRLPEALFSHSDQQTQWQTSVPQGMAQLRGWAGRMADVLHSTVNSGSTSMSISLAGNNVQQIGEKTGQFAITRNGALTLSGNANNPNSLIGRKNAAYDSLMSQTYGNLMQDAFAKYSKASLDEQSNFAGLYDGVTLSRRAENRFPKTKIGDDLKAAVKTIAIRNQLGLRRSTIFIKMGGWDHHGELAGPLNTMLTQLSQAVHAFQLALNELRLEDDVIGFTASDFGRTLRSNGRGTDHAWGGNQMVWGGPIDAGHVRGTFPDLEIGSNDDAGFGGRIIPTTSTDEYYASLVKWFGVPNSSFGDILPNLSNFTNIRRNPDPANIIR